MDDASLKGLRNKHVGRSCKTIRSSLPWSESYGILPEKKQVLNRGVRTWWSQTPNLQETTISSKKRHSKQQRWFSPKWHETASFLLAFPWVGIRIKIFCFLLKVSALSDALQSVEDGGMLTTDEESNGAVRSS